MTEQSQRCITEAEIFFFFLEQLQQMRPINRQLRRGREKEGAKTSCQKEEWIELLLLFHAFQNFHYD